ncbi:MAG: hypothetical protein LBN22_06995, partial [Clostridiales Family XIII bacterium]|nr:hypothetical protein [Clostridiales Family XIII bacterium]
MFNSGSWNNEVNVRDFIVRNYTPYDGDESFLTPLTERTQALWDVTQDLLKKEQEAGGVLDIDER